MHNLPAEDLEPLRAGTQQRTAAKRCLAMRTESVGRMYGRSVRDDYPALFCEAVHEHLMTTYMSIHQPEEVQKDPWPSNVQVSLMTDILDDLNQEELQAINRVEYGFVRQLDELFAQWANDANEG